MKADEVIAHTLALHCEYDGWCHAEGIPVKWTPTHQADAVLATLDGAGIVLVEWKPEWGDPENHVVDVTEYGWSLQHPLRSRPNLFGCLVQQAVSAQANEDGILDVDDVGRYLVDLDETETLVYVPIEVIP